MELYTHHSLNISLNKSAESDEISSFIEIIKLLNDESKKASLRKLRFTKEQNKLIKSLYSLIMEYEAYSNKTNN